MIFANREEAGEQLAAQLLQHPLIKQTAAERLQVLSIPKGGVVIGAMVAEALYCGHDVVIAKKIGAPGHPESAIGAIAEDGPAILDPNLPHWFIADTEMIAREEAQTRKKVRAYTQNFRTDRSLEVYGKTVILVDDGIATGETVKAAVYWLKSLGVEARPAKILIAVPVASPRAALELRPLVDEFICLMSPVSFWAVGQFYFDFHQIDDAEVIDLLRVVL